MNSSLRMSAVAFLIIPIALSLLNRERCHMNSALFEFIHSKRITGERLRNSKKKSVNALLPLFQANVAKIPTKFCAAWSVFCHAAGRIEPRGGNTHRMQIL